MRALIVEAFAALTRRAGAAAPRRRADRQRARSTRCSEFWQHPQLAARERWREVGSPAGPIPALLPPGNWDDGDGPRMDPVPALGQHTDALLAELGYGADDIAALRAAQAI